MSGGGKNGKSAPDTKSAKASVSKEKTNDDKSAALTDVSAAAKKAAAAEIWKPIVSLFVICLISSLLLALANKITEGPIAALAASDEQAAKQAVLADATEFGDEQTDPDTGASWYVGKDASGQIVGYVFKTKATSYGGELDIMTGIDKDGKIAGVKITTINDTPGLGMKAKTDPNFIQEFIGKSGTLTVTKDKTNTDSDKIVAITSATITSKAMTKAVNAATAEYEKITKGEVSSNG